MPVDLELPAFFLATSLDGENVPLAMLAVFGAAKLMAEILERMRQPGLVGEILAGILLGPSLLGLVHPNQMLSALAELGVLFLPFQVGLEVKSNELGL